MIGRLIRRGSVPLPLVIVAVVVAGCAPAASLPDTPSRAAGPAGQLPAEGAALVPTPAQVASLRAHPAYATEPFVVTNLLAFTEVRGRQLYRRFLRRSGLPKRRSSRSSPSSYGCM